MNPSKPECPSPTDRSPKGFRGTVISAGGGRVELRVDLDTKHYPPDGARVEVTYGDADRSPDIVAPYTPQVGDRVRLAHWPEDWLFDVEHIQATETGCWLHGLDEEGKRVRWYAPDERWRYIGTTPTRIDEPQPPTAALSPQLENLIEAARLYRDSYRDFRPDGERFAVHLINAIDAYERSLAPQPVEVLVVRSNAYDPPRWTAVHDLDFDTRRLAGLEVWSCTLTPHPDGRVK